MRLVGLILVSLIAVAVTLAAGGVRAPAAQPAKEAVAVGTGGAVASVDQDATQAGIQVLREGGNAVDAAVAANAVLGVTEPFVAGIGGGGFMVVYLAREHRVITIDGRETAPQAFPENAFIDPATGQPIPFFPQRVTSGMAVGVPGTLATWAKADSEFGTMPLRRLLQPAIAVAMRGFTVDDTFRGQVASNLSRLSAFTSSRSLFLTPNGQPPQVGSTFRNPALARTYGLIAHDGAGALYDGPIGTALVDTVRHPPLAPDAQLGFPVPPGLMTTGDLARYTAPVRAPTHVSYRGYDVYGMGPPSSGGSTIGEALNILEGYDLSTADRALALHRYLEASKLAFADRNRWVGDPDLRRRPARRPALEGLRRRAALPDRRAQRCRRRSRPGDPIPPFTPCAGAPPRAAAGRRRRTSTQPPHRGRRRRQHRQLHEHHRADRRQRDRRARVRLSAQQRADRLRPRARYARRPRPEPAGRRQAPALEHGADDRAPRRPPVARRRHARASSTIITTVLQILLNRLDFGMSLPDAIAAPRASQRNTATNVAEPAFISQYGNDLQTRFGQLFTSTPEIGAATGIEVLPNGQLQAAAEPTRRGGGAAAVVCPAAGHSSPASPHALCAPLPAH